MHIRRRTCWLGLVLLVLLGVAFVWLRPYAVAEYHHRAALAALEQRDLRQASAHLQQALLHDPHRRELQLLAAQTARRLHRYADGVAHLRAYEQGGGLAEVVALEHQLLRVQNGDLRDVEPLLDFSTAHPDLPATPLILEACVEGLCRQVPAGAQSGMSGASPLARLAERAAAALDAWARLHPGADQVQLLVWRGRAHAVANDQPKALRSLRAALALDPAQREARLFLALFQVQTAPHEALRHLRILHERHPDDNAIRLALATVLRDAGQAGEAQPLLDAVLAEQPELLVALLERGRVALDLQDPPTAELWLHARWPCRPRTGR